MKRNLFFGIALCLLLVSCRRDCEDLTPKASYKLDPALTAWIGDSAVVPYEMVSADSITESWQPLHQKPPETWINTTCQTRPLSRYDNEYRSYRCRSSLSQYELQLRLSAWEDRQTLSVGLDDVDFSYDPLLDVLTPVTTGEGQIEATRAVHDSLVVRGRVWQNVLELRTEATFVRFKAIWIAKGWGMVQLEEQGGLLWQRLP